MDTLPHLMVAMAATLKSLPYTQLRRNRYFYVWYDAFFIALGTLLIAGTLRSGWQGIFASWRPEILLWLPVVTYVQILCSVWIHNATHNNFPRPINRLVGEICGFIVLTRFASWEIIHQRHHKFSDDPVDDPHPIVPAKKGYWAYLWQTVVGVEVQLQKLTFELFGDTEENRAFERKRAVVSFLTSFVLLPLTWYLLLGPIAFFALFIPASILGFFHLVHFNWSTHNPWSPTQEFHPVNLDSGFYKIGNKIWHGIYFHGNHHKNAGLFNPMKMAADKALPVIRPGDTTEHYPEAYRRPRTRKQK